VATAFAVHAPRPGSAAPEQVRHAVDELTRLVQAGGAVAAGAGVDLGPGFRSARLAGARGDQRDAVLAALRVLGLAQAGRLGQRAGFGVALFGPAATKRVGAAAAAAIGEGRWAAVQLASAASDLLGPEQLEHVLALRPPEGVDLVQGPPSALAQHLRQVLEPLPGPRRLDLVLDLWARVQEQRARLAQREQRLATTSCRCCWTILPCPSRCAGWSSRRRSATPMRWTWLEPVAPPRARLPGHHPQRRERPVAASLSRCPRAGRRYRRVLGPDRRTLPARARVVAGRRRLAGAVGARAPAALNRRAVSFGARLIWGWAGRHSSGGSPS
jgi:hypothetical protein